MTQRTCNGYPINTEHNPKPGGTWCDWDAWICDMDIGVPVAHGRTEQEAIDNLIEMLEE